MTKDREKMGSLGFMEQKLFLNYLKELNCSRFLSGASELSISVKSVMNFHSTIKPL